MGFERNFPTPDLHLYYLQRTQSHTHTHPQGLKQEDYSKMTVNSLYRGDGRGDTGSMCSAPR